MWLWMDLGGLRIGSLLAGLFLIRYFGPANFGVYSSALAIGWVANAVTDLGVTRYAAREVASRPAERPRVIGVSLLTTLLALLMQGALVILAFLTGHEILACISGGLIYCNLEGTASFCSAVLTAELRSRDIVLSSITGVLGMVGMTILVVLLHLSVLVMLLGLCVKSVIVLSMRLWKLRSTWPTWETLGSSQLLRVIRNAWPYFKYNLTQIGYGRVAIVCFGLVASPEMVGWFAAAFTISDVFPQWSYACSNALLPLWTKLFESGRAHDLVELRQRLLDIVIFLSVPFWIGLAVFAPQVCRIFGPRFAFSAPVLRIVASRSLLAVLDGFLGHGYLIAVNQVQERQRAQSRSLVVLAVLSLLLGWLWGPVGVGVALFISDSTLILQYLRICSRVGMKIEWPALLPAGFAGAVMIAAVFATPNSLALPFEVVLVICAYFLSLFALSKDRFLSAGRTLRECVG
ncbi:MAG TPA: oligosaccharide flippase family protein [Candidatus Acidoferrum sp.]|nr:oligosaccharide flippase family protein [Candidatus Acidoferrum sp.]